MSVILHHIVLLAAAATEDCGNHVQAVICASNTGIPGGNSDLGLVVGKVMKAVFGIMGSIAVIVVMAGGLQYVLSTGDPKRTQRAKETILYAIIGIVISLSAYAIVSFITNGLG
jgi:hypothetical protein